MSVAKSFPWYILDKVFTSFSFFFFFHILCLVLYKSVIFVIIWNRVGCVVLVVVFFFFFVGFMSLFKSLQLLKCPSDKMSEKGTQV